MNKNSYRIRDLSTDRDAASKSVHSKTTTSIIEMSLRRLQNGCHPTTFIYAGHCYNTCPGSTYMVPELSPMDDDNRHSDVGASYMNLRSDDIAETPRKRAIIPTVALKRCASCDKSCQRCRGPNQSDCLACHPGYQLRIISAMESYCYILSERSSGNNVGRETEDGYHTNDSSIRYNIYMTLIVTLSTIAVIVVVVTITLFRENLGKLFWKSADYSYVRVAFDMPQDDVENLLKNDDVEEDELSLMEASA